MSWGRAGWSALVLGIGAWQLAAGWSGSTALLVFVGCVVGTHALVFGAKAVRVPTEFSMFGLILVALTGGYLVARQSTGDGPIAVLRDTIPRLLSSARPAPPAAELLVPGALLAFCVSVVVAVSVLGRGRAMIGPPIGAAVLYTAGALLTAGSADPNGFAALAIVAVVAAGWLILDRAKGSAVIPAVVLAGLAALALTASLLPRSAPFEPRTLVRPPVTDLDVSSPLPKLAYWAGAGDAELFRVTGSDAALRLVALGEYTGATWRASSVYGPIGAIAPPDLPDGKRTTESSAEITIGELDGTWLPTTGRPRSTSLGHAMVDPDSGSLVLAEGLRPGLRYRVTGVVDTPDDEDLTTATVPNGEAASRYLDLPGLPASIAEYARQSVVNTRTPYEQAVALEQVVRLNRKPDAQAPVGSSYARLETFLFGATGQSGANAGTAEQFAAAYAVLARAVGLPTRVVVGFQPTTPGPDGSRVVLAADATAWPEVYFDGHGWVPFDPVTGSDSGPSAASKREVLNRLASTTAAPTTPAPTGPPVVLPSAPPVVDAAPPPPESGSWHGLLVIPAVPLLIALVLLALRGSRRARFRRSGAAGAWAYLLDGLLLAGRSPRRDRAAPDIAADLAGFSRDGSAARLAELADRTAFAPGPAPGGGDAWGLAKRVLAGVRGTIPWYRRMFWPIDPRPLFRR